MQSEKGLEDHSKTLSLTVQTTGSHEGLQGARATGRRVAAGPSAVRLGNSLNFSESWFHHLYTGLVGINISLQNRAQLTRSPSPVTSHLPQSKSQSPPGLHGLSLPRYHPNLLQVLSPQGWALELPLPEILFQTPVQLTLRLLPADTGLHIYLFIC